MQVSEHVEVRSLIMPPVHQQTVHSSARCSSQGVSRSIGVGQYQSDEILVSAGQR